MLNESRVILSLYDYSGNWARPYRERGYTVRQVDSKLTGEDVRFLEHPGKLHGILAAPPCTDLAVSGARWWKQKGPGAFADALALVDVVFRLAWIGQPEWFVIENPVGRLSRILGKPQLIFNPCDYGDPYTKRTCLWGRFTRPEQTPVEPIRVCSQGSWVQRLGGKSERTKELRSMTPMGFARAFAKANP